MAAMSETSRGIARHPIGVVEMRTGLSQHVLRAWERRYGAVTPERTVGGQRLYTDDDVVRLRLLRRATEAGRPIATVAQLPEEKLAALVGEDARLAAEEGSAAALADTGGEGGGSEAFLAEALEAAREMDGRALRGTLMRALVGLGMSEVVDGVIAPLLERVGDLWSAGELRPRQEHVVSVVVRQVMGWLLDTFRPEPGAPVLVAGTLEGEAHEFGAMLASAAAAEAGWRVVYMGPSLPGEEIAGAAAAANAAAVVLSVIGPVEDADLARELEAVRGGLSPGRLVLVGGSGALSRLDVLERSGATPVADLAALRSLLRTVARAG